MLKELHMTELLQEFCDSRGVSVRVDRQAGVIRGVKILGLHSRNGRQYLPAALAKAASLYEGAKVNVNHPKGGPLAPRDYQERIGVIRGVELRPDDGLYGDLHFNPKHQLAEQLLWDAEHAPENVGFSHNVQARTSRRDPGATGLLVEEITRVQSVDLVADPATTRGLFEQSQAASAVAGSSLLPDVTLAQLRAARPDLVEALLQEQAATVSPSPLVEMAREAELKNLRAEVERLGAERAAAVREQSIREELAAVGLPTALVSDLFREQLRSAPDAEGRRKLIRERLQVAQRSGPASRPAAISSWSNRYALPWTPVDSKQFARRICA